jgi:heterodisulfide reductase subunit A-like polyferredoxin
MRGKSTNVGAMSEGQSAISGQVVIVGGGVAGLEALLPLRAVEIPGLLRDRGYRLHR